MATFLSGSTHTLSIPMIIKPKSREKEFKLCIRDAQGREVVCVPWTKKERGERGKTVYVFKVTMPSVTGKYSVGLLPDEIMPQMTNGPLFIGGLAVDVDYLTS